MKSPMRAMPPSELQPGDVVTPAWGERVSPFDASVVKRVSDTRVTLFRPYGTSADFVWGGDPSVICYTGIEEYSVHRDNRNLSYFVWSRME